MKRIGALALSIWMLLSPLCGAVAATLGPATTYEELLSLAASAASGDTLLVSGSLFADRPFSSPVYLYLSGEEGASISGLRIENAQLALSSLALSDGLSVRGTCHLQLMRGVSVSGGLSFSGSGSLLLDRGANVVGSHGAPGVSVCHTGGDLYVSLDGTVRGGDGEIGGAAAEFDPILASGALMVTGTLTGGEGNIGGSGLQLITASDAVAAGLGGRITGGRGDSYGGDAMLLMNVGDSSIISLSGVLTGGDSSGTDSTPGQSLKLLGRTTAMRTSVGNCILQDGRQVLYTISVTPLPAISTLPLDKLEPTPEPPPAATIEPTQAPTPEPTPEPTVEPTIEPTPEPTLEPTQAPTPEPTEEPTAEPTAEPTEEPTLEPTVEPTFAPPPAPTGEPAGDPTFSPTAEPTFEPTLLPSLPDEPTFEPTHAPVATDGEAA